MHKFLQLDNSDRKSLIVNTGRKMNMPEAIIEKDFWVCWFLNYLFTDFKYKDYICFKGGTSLSKVFHCIERFSEDIDLAIDWSIIGTTKEIAYEQRSNRQQEIFNSNSNEKTQRYLEEEWVPLIKQDLERMLNEPFEIFVSENKPQTIFFQYPRMYDEGAIRPMICLEIGALAEPVPSSYKNINSYLALAYSDVFSDEHILVNTVDVHRTFFEKITILHREANRLNGNYPEKYSRHFYDVYQMIINGVADESLDEIELLNMVVDFKKKFYHCPWAKYDEVIEGKCKLIPDEAALKIFSEDYDEMKNMFYGQYPSFGEIIDVLSEFENRLNDTIMNQLLIQV